MDLDTHKVFVSPDVIFHEHIFPFAQSPQDKLLFQSQLAQYHTEDDSVTDLQPAQEEQQTEDSQPRGSSRAHSKPGYLQDYVCCSHASGPNFCFSTLTNLCIPVSVAAEVQVVTADQVIIEPQTYTEAC